MDLPLISNSDVDLPFEYFNAEAEPYAGSLKTAPHEEDDEIQIVKIKTTKKISNKRTRELKLRKDVRKRREMLAIPKNDSFVQEELNAVLHSGLEESWLRPRLESKQATKKTIVRSQKVAVSAIPQVGDSETQQMLTEVLQMTATTPEEKFKVLDARDKLLKLMRDKECSGKRGALVGTCPDMCPEKERLMREFQNLVYIFEMADYTKNTGMDHGMAVKEYSRSSADQEEPLPHELRPVPVLKMTMSHLIHRIMNLSELNDDHLEEWYAFVWDRTRAIRKELTQQGVSNKDTVELVEQCARFHVHCAERLVDQPAAVYDDKINTENLTKCLQSLKYMYRDLNSQDVPCPNEPEFLCYSLLLNLNNSSFVMELRSLPLSVLSSAPVRFALDVLSAWETNNYMRFFNLVKKATYLNACLLRRYLNEVRLSAIKAMIRSFYTNWYTPQVPASTITNNLLYEGEEECLRHVEAFNLSHEASRDGQKLIYLDRVQFREPSAVLPPVRALVFIEAKKTQPLSEIIAGGYFVPKLFEKHRVQNSFTTSGELKLDTQLCRHLLDPMVGVGEVPTLAQIEPQSQVLPSTPAPVPLPQAVSSPLFSHIQPSTGPGLPGVVNFVAKADSPRLVPPPTQSIDKHHEELKVREEQERVARLKAKEQRELERRRNEEVQRLLEAQRREEELMRSRERAEQAVRNKREEQRRLEESLARQAILEKAREDAACQAEAERLKQLKRKEEADLENKNRVNKALDALRMKYAVWKLKVFVDKWRHKTWNATEAARMERYVAERSAKYPLVCTEQDLAGNPFGLRIPDRLVLEKHREGTTARRQGAARPLPLPTLPLLDVINTIGSILPAGSLWKLVISVPDEKECPASWKQIQTFVEMHFVERLDWKFGCSEGPLALRTSCKGVAGMCVRRLRGTRLLEGDAVDLNAVEGSSALILMLADSHVQQARLRLHAFLSARRRLPQVPVVVFHLGGDSSPDDWTAAGLVKTYVSQLEVLSADKSQVGVTECLRDAVQAAARLTVNTTTPTPVRAASLASVVTRQLLDVVWLRVETALSHFGISLKEPQQLIRFHNECIDTLLDVLLSPTCDEFILPPPELNHLLERLEDPLILTDRRPTRDASLLKKCLDEFKLPSWPAETPKSCHQLNYRIHQYCRKLTGADKARRKAVKWTLYRIIRRSLEWKALDIYSEDNIELILSNFPWTQVFKQLSFVVMEEAQHKADAAQVYVLFNQDVIREFCNAPPFISHIISSRKKIPRFITSSLLEDDDPKPEKDNLMYAYKQDVTKEESKSKRKRSADLDIDLDACLDALFSTPAGKKPALNKVKLAASFDEFNSKLDRLQQQLKDNSCLLMESHDPMSHLADLTETLPNRI